VMRNLALEVVRGPLDVVVLQENQQSYVKKGQVIVIRTSRLG
jgi:hypothetical protein